MSINSTIFRVACLLVAGSVAILLGVVGVGHGGLASTNLDMRFLYIAGLYWLKGLSPYGRTMEIQVEPDLVDVMNRFDFAYPPHIAPLCMFLASFPLGLANLLMTGMNCAFSLVLGLVSTQLATGGKEKFSVAADDGAKWFVPALIIGNFSTAYVIWAGQTTLLVAAALVSGWYCCRHDKPLIAGILIGIASIKPQLTVAVVLWLLLEQRWRTMAVAAITVLVLAIVPIMISGPVDLVKEWISALGHYPEASYNNVGSRMVFSIQSLLHAAHLPAPSLAPVAIVLMAVLWYSRSKLLPTDILGLLVGLSLLSGYSHGYDLVALAPMVPAFWGHLAGRRVASLVALGLFFIVTIPNSIFEQSGVALLTHARVLALLVCVIWLCVMSVRRSAARGGVIGPAGNPQSLTE